MLISIHPDNPDERKIRRVVEALREGAVIVYPTDTVYAIGCSLQKSKAIEQVARIKGLKPDKANFSIVCQDLSSLAEYAIVDTPVYKIMRKALPGPYTFILNASNRIPKYFNANKKSVGIRVPDNKIVRMIVEELGHPLVTTSVHDDDEIIEYTTDPELIHERYAQQVDLVIDGGFGNNEASTIIDCTSGEPELVREGIGPTDHLFG